MAAAQHPPEITDVKEEFTPTPKPIKENIKLVARFNEGVIGQLKVLVFEDAPNGVEAAHAAGMPCVWVPDPQADRDSLANEATVILESLEKFVPADFCLPPYDS